MTQSTSFTSAGTAVSQETETSTRTKTCPRLPGSGRQLRPAEPPGDADADADAEDEDSVNEVAVEDIRPRPQGSSPVYECPIEEEYSKLQEENKKHSADKSKQSHPQETMEVTLKTEAEAGASGFSVKGGGNEGIFIKKVLKESPASKVFSLREGDQLLSATIFFDNIKYEDALKILQYSEPYRVQFSLKRKIAVKEELEHSAAQYKKERISQEKELSESVPEESLHVSGKAISEEDEETLIASQRVGRSKRPKKDRLSWPKFQSIKNKKILRHRRSHSTSDAYEPAVQDISPTSTDTESQFPQEVHTREKKGSQKKLKFPSIGFRMHRSKTELQEKQKREIKTTLISERGKLHEEDISLENPEILTVEYTTSAYEMKTGEVPETLTKDLKDTKNGIPSHVKQCPEVEISIKKGKDKESTSKFSLPEVPDITTEIPKPSLEIPDLKESPTKKTPQTSSKSRKKKQKVSADKKGESGINIDLMSHTAKGSVQVKGLEIGTAKAELNSSDTLEIGKKQSEDTKILTIQKTKFGIAMPSRKETETETTKLVSDIPQSIPVKTADVTSGDGKNLDVKMHLPEAEPELSTWKIHMPSFRMTKTPKTDLKIATQESTGELEDTIKREQIEEDGMPTGDKSLNLDIGMKTGEKDTEGKESRFRLPKLKFPTFTWSTSKDETGQTKVQISETEEVSALEKRAEEEIGQLTGEIKVPSSEMEIGISKGKTNENEIQEKPKVHFPSPKKITKKTTLMENDFVTTDEDILISTTDIQIEKTEFSIKSKEKPEISQTDMKATKVDISLPSIDVTLSKGNVELQAPEASLSLEGEAKAPEKEASKSKDGKFKMPKFGMPSFGWSSSREAKGSVATEVDVSLKESQVTVPSGGAEVDVSLPGAEIQARDTEMTMDTGVAGDGEKGGFKMPDVKMPSVKLPKLKGPQAQVSLPKAEGSLPKGQEGEVAVQGPEAEGSVEVSGGKVEGSGMKIHMPKVKVPSVIFSKPSIRSPKVDANVSLPQAEVKAGAVDATITAPDIQLPSIEGSLEVQVPEMELKGPSAEVSLDRAAVKGPDLKGKLKMPKLDKPKFAVSSPKAEGPEISLPSADVELPSATVMTAGESPIMQLKADVPSTKMEGASLKLEKPSLKMPQADIKALEVDISLPSVDVTLPKATVELQAPEVALCLEGETKSHEKEASKSKDGKFKMPKFGMTSFGWSSSREAKGSVAGEVDVSLKEPQVTVPSGGAEVDVSLPGAEIQAPSVEVMVETGVTGDVKKSHFKMPDVKMPDIKLPKLKDPQAQVSLPKAEGSLPKGQGGDVDLQGPAAEGSVEVSGGKVEGSGMKIHMPKVKVPSMVFSKPTVKSPKVDTDVSLPQAELKAGAVDATITAPDIQLPSVEGSLEVQAPDMEIKAPSVEVSLEEAELKGPGLKGKLKMPKLDKPKFTVSSPKAEEPKISLPSAEVELPSSTVTTARGSPIGDLKADIPTTKMEGASWKLEKPSLKMPQADVKAPKVDISLPSVDVTLPKASVELQAPEVAMNLEGEAKSPEKEASKSKDGKFKMPKFGMPSFGWSSSREAKGTVATEVDVTLKGPQIAVPSGVPIVDVSLPEAEIQVPDMELTVEAGIATEREKGHFKIPDVKMPKLKGPQVQVSLPKAEGSLPKGQEGDVDLQGPDAKGSLEVSGGKVEGSGMKIHMPKVKVPSVVFSKPTVKSPKVDADVSLPQAELKAGAVDASITAPDIKLPSIEGSLEVQAPEMELKAPSAEVSLDEAELKGSGLKGKLKMPKFDKPKFAVSSPRLKGLEVRLPSAEVELPPSTLMATGESPVLDLKGDVPSTKMEAASWKLEKPSLEMPQADIKAPEVDISQPSVDVPVPKASVELQAPEASLSLEGEAKAPGKEASKSKDGKFKMPKFGMPSFGWSSSREAKGSVAGEVDVSLKEPQVTVPSGGAEVDVSLPGAEIQAPSVEVTVETGVTDDVKKSHFKMPDVKMPSVKLPKLKDPQAQVSLPKAEESLPKGQGGEVALQGPEAEGSLEVSAGKVEGGGMKIHVPEMKVPSVVFSKPTVKSPKLDTDISLPQAELKAGTVDASVTAPDIKLPSIEGSLEVQAPEMEIKATAAEDSLDVVKVTGTDPIGKLRMPKFDKPKFAVSSPKAKGSEVTLLSAEVKLPSATVAAAGDGPAIELKADVPTTKMEGASWKLQKPSLEIPQADIKAPEVDTSLPSIDITVPKASVELQAPEASLSLEGEAKAPEMEASKSKDGKFKMPKFGMPSFGWSSSREAKRSVAGEVDVSLKEPQVTVPSGGAEVDVSLPGAEIQPPSVEVTVETGVTGDVKKSHFNIPDVKMPSVKLPRLKDPQVQVSLPKAEGSLPKGQEGDMDLQGPADEGSLEVSAGKVEGGGMKIHMPKVKVPSVVFSKPSVKSPKVDTDISLPQAELKAGAVDATIKAPDIQLPSVEGSLEVQAPEMELKAPSAEVSLDRAAVKGLSLKGKLKMPKFDKPKFTVSSPKVEGPEISLPSADVERPSATVMTAGESPIVDLKASVPSTKTEGASLKLEKPSLKMPQADIKALEVDISQPSVDVTLPKATMELQAPEVALCLEGEAKAQEKEAGESKDGKFKMPKFGMPSFGWSSSREAKGSVAGEVDVSLKEPQVTVPSGGADVDVSLPGAEIQAPSMGVLEQKGVAGDIEKSHFKMPDIKMPRLKGPQVQVSLPKAEGSLPKGQEGDVDLQGPEAEGSVEVSGGKVEGSGMKIHMPKVKVPSVVFSKPTIRSPKVDADVSLPQAELKAGTVDTSIMAPDIQLPSVEASLEVQAPEMELKAPSAEVSLEEAELKGLGLKGKLKMPKFDKPKFAVSSPRLKGLEVSLPSAEVELPSSTLTAIGESPVLDLKGDVPSTKMEAASWKLEKPSLEMPQADIKAPEVDISQPSVDVTVPKANVGLQAREASLSLEGEAKAPEKEASKSKDGKFKMPKFGMPSFGWSSSREAKGSIATEVDVSLKEPQVTVPSGGAEVDVSLPGAEIQPPSVEVTVEKGVTGDVKKSHFKMPDVKMPSVKLPKLKDPQAQVSLPKAEGSLPKGQEGEVALQGPEAEGSLEVSGGKVEGGGMKIHVPEMKVPSVVFSKPTVMSPKLDTDISLPQAEVKAGAVDASVTAPDIKLPSIKGTLEVQAPEVELKTPSAEVSLEGAKVKGPDLKGKLKMPKFDKPKFTVSSPKVEGPEMSLPSSEVELPSATVMTAGECPIVDLKASVPSTKMEGASLMLEKPSLKMPQADIKAPEVDISQPSVDVTLPKATMELQAPEVALCLEGEAKAPGKEAGKSKDGKFKMPKFGMPSFGWSSSREAKGSVAGEVDVSLKEPQVTVPSGGAEVDVSLPGAEIQAPSMQMLVEKGVAGDVEKSHFKMPDIKMPKLKGPQVQVSLPKAEGSLPKGQEGDVDLQGPDAKGSLEVSGGKVEGSGMKIHMPKVKVPSVVFSKPTVKSPKVDADVSLPQAELKAGAVDASIKAPGIQLPSIEGFLEVQAPEMELKAPSAEVSLDEAELKGSGLKGKLKMPKFDKPKFAVSSPKSKGLEVRLPSVEVELPSSTLTATGESPVLELKGDVPSAKMEEASWKLEKPSLEMPQADIKAPEVDISQSSVDITVPKASVELQVPEASLSLKGEAKAPEKEASKSMDGKFKMPKFGMPSFGWSSSREAKGSVATEVDVSLKEPQVTVPSGGAEVDVSLPGAEIQPPSVEVTVETGVTGDVKKSHFKMPDVKMPSVKLPKLKGPQAQVSLPKAEGSLPKGQEGDMDLQGPADEGSLEVSGGKVEGSGMKIHMPKVKVPSVVFSKPSVKSPKVDADVSLPQAELKAGAVDASIKAPDIQLPSMEGSLEVQAPEMELKAPSAEVSLDGAEVKSTGLKGKLKMPKFDKPKFAVSSPKSNGLEVSLPSVEVELPSSTLTATGESPVLDLKGDVPSTKMEAAGWKLEKPSLEMPQADIKAPEVDISQPSVDVTVPKASVELQAPEASLSLEGEAKSQEKEASKSKDGKFKMPKFGMPSFGWSSSREAKGSVAGEVDVSLKEPQVTVPSGGAEVDVSLPGAEIQAPSVEVTVETGVTGDVKKSHFKMPDVKMPSVKLPKLKDPQAQVSLPKAEVSLPKGQEGKVALQGPEAEGSLEVSGGRVEGGGMKIHVPEMKVPSVVFSKPTVMSPKVDTDISLPQAEVKAGTVDASIKAPDIKLPSIKGTLEVQLPEVELKAPSAEVSQDGAAVKVLGLKGKLKMPKFDKPKFTVSSPKAEGPEISLPSADVELPSATVMTAGESPIVDLKASVPSTKMEGASLMLEKPSLKMPQADIKAPEVDISQPSVDVTLPKATMELQAPEVGLCLEGEAKFQEKEAGKSKDGKFKMPKFGMPSFGWSSSREAKGSVAGEVDVSLKEPQVTVPSGGAEVDVSLPGAEIQALSMEVLVEKGVAGDVKKSPFKMPDIKMPRLKGPQVQVSLPKAEGSLPKGQEGDVDLQGPVAEGSVEVSGGKVEGSGMKIHMPKVKVPSVVFSKPTVKSPKMDTDVSLPQAELKAGAVDASIKAPDIQLPSVEGSLEVQAPEMELKAPSAEVSLEEAELKGPGLKGKLKMPKFDKPKFAVSSPKLEAREVSLPSAEVELPSSTLTATGESPVLDLKGDVPSTKMEAASWKLEKPSLEMPQADIKAPEVDISQPSVDVTVPKASVELPVPEASLSLEGEAKAPEMEASKSMDGKFKMPKFGMPSFGWSSSREAKGSVATKADVSLKEPQVTVPSGGAEVDVSLPGAEIQAPSVEVTVETGVTGDVKKSHFKMPDVKMPSVKLPKLKGPQAQVSLPKAEGSLLKGQEGEVALQGPEAKGSLEVSAGRVEGSSMKIHMPKVKVPSVVFSKPSIKSPKVDADISLPLAQVKAGAVDVSIKAPDIKLPSIKGSLEVQAPEMELKGPSAEVALDGAELKDPGLKGKLKMPKFDKTKFTLSSAKAEEPEICLPSVEAELPSAMVTTAMEGPVLDLQASVPSRKTETADWKLEKPSLEMPQADIKAPKVDISLPSVDVTLPKATMELQAPEVDLCLEGEAKFQEKEAGKSKDGKFKMPKFGMPSFGWSSSREAKGSVATEVDVSLKEPQVTVPSGGAEVDVSLRGAEIQALSMEVLVEKGVAGDVEKSHFKTPDVKLPKLKRPQAQVSLPKAEGSLPKGQGGDVDLQGPVAEGSVEVSGGKVEGSGMKIHMPKVKVPSVVFSKPTVKSPKVDADVSLPQAELKAGAVDASIKAPDIQLPSVEGSLEVQAPEMELKAASAEVSLDEAELKGPGLKGKLKMPKFDKPKFAVSSPKSKGLEVSLPSAEVELPSSTLTATGESPVLDLKGDVPSTKMEAAGWKLEKPSLEMPQADIKAPEVDISQPSVDVTVPKASVELQAPEASLNLEGEAKAPEKEASKSKDGKFKMPKFGMPSFGWSSSREAKGSVATEVDVSLKEPQVTVPSGGAEVDVSLPGAKVQPPSVEVTVETGVTGDVKKSHFKMPDVKMPDIKLPKLKDPQAQVSLPKAEGSLPKGQEGEVALQGPVAEGSLEVSGGKVEGSGMKIHMPKVKVPSVVFSKPSVKSPKVDADVSLPQAELKAGAVDVSIKAPDIQLPSIKGSLDVQAPEMELKGPSAEVALDGAELKDPGLKGKLKMPKFDKPKFTLSSAKAEEPEICLPSVEVELPSAMVTTVVEGPVLDLQASMPSRKAETADWKLEKPSLEMPQADVKAPKVDISLPSVDVTVPKASMEMQTSEVSLCLEGEAKAPEKEASKSMDGKFKMPKFGMPSFGWSSSREAKDSVAGEVDVSLKEPQVTVPLGCTEVDVSLPGPEIPASSVEVMVEKGIKGDDEKGRFKMPDVKMPNVKLPKLKGPQAQVSMPKAEGSLPNVQEGKVALQSPKAECGLEVSAGKVEGGGMKIHMPKVTVPSVVFSKPTVKSPKVDKDISLPQAELKAGAVDASIMAPDIKLPSVEGSLDVQVPEMELKATTAEVSLDGAQVKSTGLKGKLKMPKLDKPKFTVSSPKVEGPGISLPSAEVELPSATLTATVVGPAIMDLKGDVPGTKMEEASWKLEKPSLKMPQADIKAPEVDISMPSVDITVPKARVELQAPEASLCLEGEAKAPEKEAGKSKDGKFKMPKFGMPSFGWSSSREAKGSVAAESDVSLKEPQVTVPSGGAEVDVSLPGAEIEVSSSEIPRDSSSEKEDEMFKSRSSVFKIPKVSLSKSFKPYAQTKSGVDVSVSESICYSVREESSAVPSGNVESKPLPDFKGDNLSKKTKFRIPSLGFSKVDLSSSESDQKSSFEKEDITLTKYEINVAESESKIPSLADEHVSDFEILSEDDFMEQEGVKPEGKTTASEISFGDREITVKIPKFQKPKFGIRSKEKASESDVSSKVESEISQGRMTCEITDPDIEKTIQISDSKSGVKLHKPSLEVVLDAPTLDPNLSPVEVTMPKLKTEIHGPDLECKAEQDVISGEKDTEKESKVKSSKFKLPSFRWSPKKEVITPSHVEEHLEQPTSSTLSGDAGSELTFPTPENQYVHVECDTSIEKDDEKDRSKKSQFTMPKISFPKIKGQKVQVSLPILENDVCGPKQEKKDVSVQKSEKQSSGEEAGMGIKMPKVTVPTSEFSKAPEIEVDISMPTGEVILPTCEEDDLKLKSAAANASLSTSGIKMTTEGSLEMKSPDMSVEITPSEIAVGDVEIKIEGSEGKTKMPKFQMPKLGIALSKGKGSEKEVGQAKSEVKVPQLKAMVEISDIAVEAPNLEVECGTGTESYSPKVKMTKTDSMASEADVHFPSADISIPKADSDVQDSDAALKIKGEIKQDGDGEEKEGHFKMPKFKLPSFSWSPKKEASIKADSGANLEDPKLAVSSSRIDTEVRGTAADDEGSGTVLDLETSTGRVEQKSPIKKPQFVMPKISLSKIKVPKSQSHSSKAEADATLLKTERDVDDSIQIPDIEKTHSKTTEEGAQISITMADVKLHTQKFSKAETEPSQNEMGVSSAKTDAALTLSEGSFQQVDLKSSSTDECNTQKTGMKFPKAEASVELKSPDIVTERSSVMDGRKVKLEGPEGKIKMPKFQKPKFGISLTKGKSPEAEISSPKIEAEKPQLKMKNEIADVTVGVPASEFTSDMSDPGVVCKTKTLQDLTTDIEAPKVDLSLQSVSKIRTEGAIESLEDKEIKLKEEHEIKAEEVQTEEHQGWFKMPKFRIPAFGRTSLKEKKSDAGIEKRMEKTQASTPSAKVQIETSIPERTFSLPHAVAEITVGKEGIKKSEDSVKSSDVSLSKVEGDISLCTERTDSGVNIPKTETYADIVKRGAEGQKAHVSEFTVSAAELSKSSLSASETDKDNSSTDRFPTGTLTFQEQQVKPHDTEVPKAESSTKLETSVVGCKPSPAEITLDATREKTDVNLPKGEIDIQNKEAVIKKGKIKGDVKITGKDIEEGQFKTTACEWSTTEESEDGTYVTAKLGDLKVEVPEVKKDVKITRVDPEMKFQVKSVEKDVSAGVEVQVEDRAETSKIKAYKFKIPKFGMLRSEIKEFEDDVNVTKSEADSVSKSEIGTAEMQLQKLEGSICLKSSALDHKETPARTTEGAVDQSQGGPEVVVRIPKLKIPRFTFKTLPIEADVLLSKVVTDPKGSSTDIEVVQLEASSAIPEETPGALERSVQKAKSKILTLTEPDIKTAKMTTTLESSLSNAGQDIHWSYAEGQEVSEKVELEHVAIERCEIYTTEILKESEVLSSEIKTATLGFSLLKAKLPESHSDLEVSVQQPSPTEGVSLGKPTCAGESFGVAAQRTGSAELKLSDKPHHESEESTGEVSLPKLKTGEVKPSSKPEDKSPEGITSGPLPKDEGVAEAVEGEEKDKTNENDKTDSKRSPGRFKFWLPSIGFSSSGDENNTDTKAEVKKSVPEDTKPSDTSDDSSKQTEKTGWFKFPKLGFTSPSKKAKSVDKEEMGQKEGRISDEDSPSDKPDVFFDAQESLSPRETTEGEKVEIDEASSIVTSSARTELILLEEAKDSKSNTDGDAAK